MHKKGWLTPLAVVLVFIGILITYQNSYMDNILATSTSKTQLPWDKDIADIQKIAFSWQKDQIIATRTNNHWNLTAPIEAPADSSYIYHLISSFGTPGIIKTVATDDIDFNHYGITETSPILTLYDNDNIAYDLICGKPYDDLHYYTYSTVTDTVYTIPKTLFDSISTKLSSWYDKNYIYFSPDTTSHIEIIYQDTLHRINANHTTPLVTFSSDSLTDANVDAILKFLKTSKIEQLITTNTSEHLLETYGFNTDSLILKIHKLNREVLEFQINIHAPTDQGYYVYLPQSSTLLTIPLFNIEPTSSTR